ncbi:Thioredoxin-like fold [Trinorchestia longiramus]|nr:Thioredoxin-like fold [Trinorchestia longiramus]
MALTLVDLLGETLLVPRNSASNSNSIGVANIIESKFGSLETRPPRLGADSSTAAVTMDAAAQTVSADNTCQRESVEGPQPADDHREVEEWNLVSKDGVVLDIINVCDLMKPGVVIALYFTCSASPDNREISERLETLSRNRGFKLSQTRPDSSPSSSRDEAVVVVVVVAGDEACYRRGLVSTSFCAVPYYHHRVRRGLCRKFRVSSLASLVLLDARSSRVLSRPSLETLAADPEGLKFPWRPRSVSDILETAGLVYPDGRKASYSDFKDGFKGLYFAAYWCPPCKAFTPQLIETYGRIKENGHNFEVIFVSSDRSSESHTAHHSTMMWPGLEWRYAQERRELAAALQVEGIPTLVLLGPDCSVLTHACRTHVARDPHAEEFPWRDESVELLEERHMATLLDRPCFIIFTDTDDGAVLEQYRDELLPVAEEYLLHRAAPGPPDGDTLAFFVAPESGMSEYVRAACGVDDTPVQVCIIDVADNRRYDVQADTEVSTAALHSFITRYNRHELEADALSDSAMLDRNAAGHQNLICPESLDPASGDTQS